MIFEKPLHKSHIQLLYHNSIGVYGIISHRPLSQSDKPGGHIDLYNNRIYTIIIPFSVFFSIPIAYKICDDILCNITVLTVKG